MKTFLVGGTVYTPDDVVERGTVVVEEGKIVAISSACHPEPEGRRIDVTGSRGRTFHLFRRA